MKGRKLILAALPALALTGLFLLGQGCKGQLPSASAMAKAPTATPTAVCQPYLLNGFETLGDNGAITGTSAMFSLSTSHVVQGSHSLNISILSASNWNDNIFLLSGFTPNTLSPYAKLIVHLTVDPNVVAGASYGQFLLFADSGTTYYKKISSTMPALVAGAQALTYNLDFPIQDDLSACFPSTSPVSKIFFIYNRAAPSAGQGTGHIYMDDMRLIETACLPTPTPTNTPSSICPFMFNDFESLTENGTWSGTSATRSLSTLNATHGAHSMDVNITTSASYNQNVMILEGFAPATLSGYTQLTMDLTVDASVLAGSSWTPQLVLVADSNSASKYFQPISDAPTLTSGTQSVTFNIDYTKGTLLPTNPINKLTFVVNRDTCAAGQGVGHLYVDNMRLICP